MRRVSSNWIGLRDSAGGEIGFECNESSDRVKFTLIFFISVFLFKFTLLAADNFVGDWIFGITFTVVELDIVEGAEEDNELTCESIRRRLDLKNSYCDCVLLSDEIEFSDSSISAHNFSSTKMSSKMADVELVKATQNIMFI